MNKTNIIISAIFMLLIYSFTANGQVIIKKAITLEAAKRMAAAAEAEAVRNKWAMVIAIVDDGGNLVYLERMDDVQIGSIDVSIDKAKTAIFFRRSTKIYQERVQSGANFILRVPGIIPVEGGLPIVVDGQYIGAVGVSGGTPDQDGVTAKAAIDAFSEK